VVFNGLLSLFSTFVCHDTWHWLMMHYKTNTRVGSLLSSTSTALMGPKLAPVFHRCQTSGRLISHSWCSVHHSQEDEWRDKKKFRKPHLNLLKEGWQCISQHQTWINRQIHLPKDFTYSSTSLNMEPVEYCMHHHCL
jgi:hypothetical protein